MAFPARKNEKNGLEKNFFLKKAKRGERGALACTLFKVRKVAALAKLSSLSLLTGCAGRNLLLVHFFSKVALDPFTGKIYTSEKEIGTLFFGES